MTVMQAKYVLSCRVAILVKCLIRQEKVAGSRCVTRAAPRRAAVGEQPGKGGDDDLIRQGMG